MYRIIFDEKEEVILCISKIATNFRYRIKFKGWEYFLLLWFFHFSHPDYLEEPLRTNKAEKTFEVTFVCFTSFDWERYHYFWVFRSGLWAIVNYHVDSSVKLTNTSTEQISERECVYLCSECGVNNSCGTIITDVITVELWTTTMYRAYGAVMIETGSSWNGRQMSNVCSSRRWNFFRWSLVSFTSFNQLFRSSTINQPNDLLWAACRTLFCTICGVRENGHYTNYFYSLQMHEKVHQFFSQWIRWRTSTSFKYESALWFYCILHHTIKKDLWIVSLLRFFHSL